MSVPLERRELIGALRVAFALSAAGALVALGVRIAAAGEVRNLLGFTFPGVPQHFGEALAIFANNVRVLLAVAVASAVAQASLRTHARGAGRVLSEALVRVCDVTLLLACLIQVALVGATIGAYGLRGFVPILAHLPFELAAFSLALALYLDCRRMPIPIRQLGAATLVSAVVLALGACVEVYA
jgi:hypothetical protein